MAFAAESTVLDPTEYSAGVDHYFVSQMFGKLVRPDPSLKTVNWLAESRKVIPIRCSPIIGIRIRNEVKFHNGDPLTAGDFEFAYDKLRDPKVSRWSHL
jgi:peptide/nickel transport system substrate-binding protein